MGENHYSGMQPIQALIKHLDPKPKSTSGTLDSNSRLGLVITPYEKISALADKWQVMLATSKLLDSSTIGCLGFNSRLGLVVTP